MKQFYLLMLIFISLNSYAQDCSTIGNTDPTGYMEISQTANNLLGDKFTLTQPSMLHSINIVWNTNDAVLGGGVQMAVYDDNGGVPNNLVVSAMGTIGIGGASLAVTPQVLPAGDYWVMANLEITGNPTRVDNSNMVTSYYTALPFGDPVPTNASGFTSYNTRAHCFYLGFDYVLGTDTRTECSPYTWIDGNVYTADNNTATHNIVGGAANGCDSLVTLDLSILYPATGTDTRTECIPYTWIDGNEYTADNNTATHNIIGGAANGCDSLVTLDLTTISPTSGTDTRTECSPYTWIDGNVYTANNNSATHNIVGGAANGCDSLVTLDLTINSVSDLSTSINGNTITSNNTGATYQWIDCDNNDTYIATETSQSFTPNASGNYAVELTENGCIDTTACISLTVVGIEENNFGDALVVSPNPTHGNFTIDLGNLYQNAQISITDISGKLIQSKKFNQSQVINISLEAPNGIYIISVQAEDKKAVIRLIKE